MSKYAVRWNTVAVFLRTQDIKNKEGGLGVTVDTVALCSGVRGGEDSETPTVVVFWSTWWR